MNEKEITRINVGNSGEYFVSAELERRGFEATVLGNNCKDFDIIAYHIETHIPIFLQVKTTKGYKKVDKRKTKWLMSRCKLIRDNLFYIMVDLNDVNTPEYHIIPSEIVYNQTENRHNNYIKNKKHKDTNMREFFDNENQYINNWNLLIDFCMEQSKKEENK